MVVILRDRAVGQLVSVISSRSQVRVLLPQPSADMMFNGLAFQLAKLGVRVQIPLSAPYAGIVFNGFSTSAFQVECVGSNPTVCSRVRAVFSCQGDVSPGDSRAFARGGGVKAA